MITPTSRGFSEVSLIKVYPDGTGEKRIAKKVGEKFDMNCYERTLREFTI
jgi:hypothetical protein